MITGTLRTGSWQRVSRSAPAQHACKGGLGFPPARAPPPWDASFSCCFQPSLPTRQPSRPPIHSCPSGGSLSCAAAVRRQRGSKYNLLLGEWERRQAGGWQGKDRCRPCGRSPVSDIQLLVATAYCRHRRAAICISVCWCSPYMRPNGSGESVLLGAGSDPWRWGGVCCQFS